MSSTCPSCETDVDPHDWRCDDCGKDLVDADNSTTGRQGGDA